MTKKLIFFSIVFIFFISCSEKDKKNQEKLVEEIKLTEEIKIEIPDFNEDSAYKYVYKQVQFGPRVISSKAWKECALWIKSKFDLYTEHVKIQKATITTYDGKNHTLQNIIASFSPEKANRIALFAHWDSRHIADHDTINVDLPILGANDGGSGVGVLIEVARQLKLNSPTVGVDIVLFDAEDYGDPDGNDANSWCLGSQHWGKNPHVSNYKANFGILLDMVGGENATFYFEENSRAFAFEQLNKVWSVAHSLGFQDFFIFSNSPAIHDDHVYVNNYAKIPTINIIEYDPLSKTGTFNKHWHTHRDNMDNICKKTLNAVGQTLLKVIYSE